MKTLLFALLFIPSLSWAAYQPVTGSTITVNPPAGTNFPVYVVNPTTAPIQIQTSGGSLTSVGYQTGGSSVPVQIQNTASVQGTYVDVSGRNALPTSDVDIRRIEEMNYLQNYGNALSALNPQYGFEIR